MSPTCLRAALVLPALLGAAGCEQRSAGYFQGYAEGEFVMISPASAGRLEKRWVKRGDEVTAGAPLFALELENEKAGRREAEAQVKNAEAKLANLATGRRAPEVDAVRAQEAQAKAARALSTRQLRQQERLFKDGYIAQAALDQARAAYARDIARVEELEAQVRAARIAIGREKEIAGARAEVEAARAALAQSDWRLQQRAASAPAAGLIHDTFYSEGEWIQAGSPVVSLLPPGNVKLRFFVAEAEVGALRVGQPVSVACDGCGGAFAASISYVSRQAEYTPPVIYSREQRSKLVFLVEARPAPADAARLHPGQPVEVMFK